MKKSLFIAALILSCLSIKIADAQVSLSLNIGSQPEWGPTGYNHADYYYMPDIDAYYDVNAHQYVYSENNVWVHNAVLPSRYHFDRYNSYKVVVNQPTPWVHHADIRTRYASYRGRHDQAIIRSSHDSRYANHYRETGAQHVAVEQAHNQRVRSRNQSAEHHNEVVANHNAAVAKHNEAVKRNIHKEEHKEHHN